MIFWSIDNKLSGYTGEDLLFKISGFRNQIQKAAIPSGAKVIPAIPISVDTICALLALQSLGMIPVSPPSNSGIFSSFSFIKNQHIKALILIKKPGFLSLIVYKLLGLHLIFQKESDQISEDWKPTLVNAHQAALITYTSGSTGKPKAINRNHQVLTAQHLVLKKIFPPFEGQKDFPLFPNILLHNLATGVPSVIPAVHRFKVVNMVPEIIIQQIKENKVNSITGNVFYFTKIIEYLEKQPQFFEEVKALGIGGSPVPEKLIKALQNYFNKADCYIIYGSSEAEPIAVRKADLTHQNPLNGFYVGKPVEDIQIKINGIDELKTAQGDYHLGEIEVKGDHVAIAGNKWLATGDYGYFTECGDLYLTARKGNEATHFGLQHYQIEHLILQQNAVEKVAAIAVSNGFNLFVKGEVSTEEIWNSVHANLPSGLIKSVVIKEEIPVDARHHSKILYEKLK